MSLARSFSQGWWNHEVGKKAMVRCQAPEAVVYAGLADNLGWHLFYYSGSGGSFPLFVKFVEMDYPHASPHRFAEYRVVLSPTVKSHVWLVDYRRSMSTLHTQDPAEVRRIYPLWKNADVALCEASMVWSKNDYGVHTADEVFSIGGWVNGCWSATLTAFLEWDYRIEAIENNFMKLADVIRLPAQAYQAGSEDCVPPRWECVERASFAMNGRRLPDGAVGMVDSTRGLVLGAVPASEYRYVPNASRAIVLRSSYLVSRNPVSFYKPSADGVDAGKRTSGEDLWLSPVWSIGLSSDLHELPLTSSWRPGELVDLRSDDWLELKDSDESVAKERYRSIQLQQECFISALLMSPPLSEQKCTSDPAKEFIRDIELRCVPIAGVCAGTRLFRLSLSNQSKYELKWARALSEMGN